MNTILKKILIEFIKLIKQDLINVAERNKWLLIYILIMALSAILGMFYDRSFDNKIYLRHGDSVKTKSIITDNSTVICKNEEFYIKIAKKFCNKFHIAYVLEEKPTVKGGQAMFGQDIAEVNFHDTFQIRQTCVDREVLEYVDRKYYIYNNWIKKGSAQFIYKEQAKDIVDSIAQKISIPSDMVFDTITRNAINGFYTARWVRQVNGYKYMPHKIEITIDGVEGRKYERRFIRYFKTFVGNKPAINKGDALVLAWRHYRNSVKDLSEETWWKLKNRYKINIDFRYVLFEDIYNSKEQHGRLSWVINFQYIDKTVKKLENKPKYIIPYFSMAVDVITREVFYIKD